MNKITLSLSLNEVKIIYEKATLERKLELKELCPELNPISIIDRVKTYEDALKVLGKKDFNQENLYNREIARRKLEIIIEALNDGWEPDWDNYSQLKWYPYFEDSFAGASCPRSTYYPSLSTASIGSRLYCKSKEIADYVGQNFLDLYKQMF